MALLLYLLITKALSKNIKTSLCPYNFSTVPLITYGRVPRCVAFQNIKNTSFNYVERYKKSSIISVEKYVVDNHYRESIFSMGHNYICN